MTALGGLQTPMPSGCRVERWKLTLPTTANAHLDSGRESRWKLTLPTRANTHLRGHDAVEMGVCRSRRPTGPPRHLHRAPARSISGSRRQPAVSSARPADSAAHPIPIRCRRFSGPGRATRSSAAHPIPIRCRRFSAPAARPAARGTPNPHSMPPFFDPRRAPATPQAPLPSALRNLAMIGPSSGPPFDPPAVLDDDRERDVAVVAHQPGVDLELGAGPVLGGSRLGVGPGRQPGPGGGPDWPRRGPSSAAGRRRRRPAAAAAATWSSGGAGTSRGAADRAAVDGGGDGGHAQRGERPRRLADRGRGQRRLAARRGNVGVKRGQPGPGDALQAVQVGGGW